MLDRITPLILTYNEGANLRRVLERLDWAGTVLVIDSGSTDGTLDLLAAYPNVTVLHRAFDHFAHQWNFGLEHVETPWVLTLDADYVLSEELVEELRELTPEADAYRARFRYCVAGRPLRASLYPDRTVLFRPSVGRFTVDGHRQVLEVDGVEARLAHPIDHDDRKSLSRWLDNQRRYAAQEVDKLVAADPRELGAADRLRRRGLAPLIMPVYCLFAKRLILDGAAGWRYTLERTYAEVLLALALTERRLTAGEPDT